MWLGQFAPSQVNVLGFWAASEHRWVHGQLRTVHRRLVDAFNADPEQMRLVEQATPHSLARGPRRSAPACRGGVAIANVLYCVPIEDAETPAAPQDSHAWVVKTPERVELGLGPFEVTGYLYLPEGATLTDTLGVVRNRFLALTEVTVRRLDHPKYAQQYPIVVVNGRRVEYVLPAQETAELPRGEDQARDGQLVGAGAAQG